VVISALRCFRVLLALVQVASGSPLSPAGERVLAVVRGLLASETVQLGAAALVQPKSFDFDPLPRAYEQGRDSRGSGSFMRSRSPARGEERQGLYDGGPQAGPGSIYEQYLARARPNVHDRRQSSNPNSRWGR
jgi:hypothetical protein